jgi:3-hydroxy acid dehydrogenase/malonic semialdehyde reductase
MLKNKIIFITGATSGIGEACAHAFAKLGARILLCARRYDQLKKISKQIQDQYQVDVYYFTCDVRDQVQVQTQLSDLPSEWKDIYLLLNNAGLAAGLDTIQDADTQDWEDMINTNVKGLLYVTKFILPTMIAKNLGHIINIGSIAGHETYSKGVVYCATKQAVNVISNGLRMDLSGTSIRVSSVDPGAVETNFSYVRFKGDAARATKVYEGFDPLVAEDIADAVVYCATRPAHVNISEMVVMPTAQATATMISRK